TPQGRATEAPALGAVLLELDADHIRGGEPAFDAPAHREHLFGDARPHELEHAAGVRARHALEHAHARRQIAGDDEADAVTGALGRGEPVDGRARGIDAALAQPRAERERAI